MTSELPLQNVGGLQQISYPIKFGSTMVLRNGKHLLSKGRGLSVSSRLVAAPWKKMSLQNSLSLFPIVIKEQN